jgi:hypothetical protein
MTCRVKLQPSVESPALRQPVVSFPGICDTTSGDFVKTQRRDFPCPPHGTFKPLTAVHAMTYCPPGQGLKPTILANEQAGLLEGVSGP